LVAKIRVITNRKGTASAVPKELLVGAALQVAEKRLEDVILSAAKNLFFIVSIENKTDSSARRKTPGFRMTPHRFFQQPLQPCQNPGLKDGL